MAGAKSTHNSMDILTARQSLAQNVKMGAKALLEGMQIIDK